MQKQTARPIRTDHDGSMAEKTARERWPKLVQNMIDDLRDASAVVKGDAAEEGQSLVKDIEKLKEDILANSTLT